jgi:transcriptional regulator with XRE-family HTH domain
MNIEIANRLVELRKKNGMSQEELAAKLGLSRQAVSKWERAEASPDTDNLICLAKLYGVSLDQLLETDKSVEDIIDESGTAEKTSSSNEKKKSEVHIGPSGIHVVDEGEEVHIGIGGIHVTDKDSNVHIGPGGIHIDDRKKPEPKGVRLREILTGIYALAIAVAYVFIGLFTRMWHPYWLLFLTIPLFSSVFDCFIYKRITKFAFPVLVTGAYLLLGFVIVHEWHPWWAIFLTIPLFYVIFRPIERLWLKTEIHITSDDDDDDDDDDDEDEDDEEDDDDDDKHSGKNVNIEINGKEVKSFKVTRDGKTIEIVPEEAKDASSK